MTRMLVRHCDLTDFSSIRDFSEEFKRGTYMREYLCEFMGILEEDHVDILINNAGIMFYPKFETTADGHEMTWQSNYLGMSVENLVRRSCALNTRRSGTPALQCGPGPRMPMLSGTTQANAVSDHPFHKPS